MPTYEYACTACGEHVEVHQRLTDDALTKCESCGGVLRKVFHPAGIVFKGSGFYATDSRSGSKSTSSSSATSTSSTSSSPTSSDSGSEGSASGPSKTPSETTAKGGEKAATAPAPATATEAAK